MENGPESEHYNRLRLKVRLHNTGKHPIMNQIMSKIVLKALNNTSSTLLKRITGAAAGAFVQKL